MSPFDVSLNDVVSGLTRPMAFEFLASDPTKLFIAEKRGMVHLYDASPLATGGDPVFQRTILDIRSIVNDVQDRGLMDIAIHPDLENSPYLYAFYVVDPPGAAANSGNAGIDGVGNRFSHLVRYTLDESTGLHLDRPGQRRHDPGRRGADVRRHQRARGPELHQSRGSRTRSRRTSTWRGTRTG